jgi:hypothetical protein
MVAVQVKWGFDAIAGEDAEFSLREVRRAVEQKLGLA